MSKMCSHIPSSQTTSSQTTLTPGSLVNILVPIFCDETWQLRQPVKSEIFEVVHILRWNRCNLFRLKDSRGKTILFRHFYEYELLKVCNLE